MQNNVKILDGIHVIAEHVRSDDKAKQIEDTAASKLYSVVSHNNILCLEIVGCLERSSNVYEYVEGIYCE